MTTETSLQNDRKVMDDVFKRCELNYKSGVEDRMLGYIRNYVTTIVQDAIQYAKMAKKNDIYLDDVNLAIEIQQEKNYASPPEGRVAVLFRSTSHDMHPSSSPHNDMPPAKNTLDTGLLLPPKHYLSTCNIHHKSAAMVLEEKEAAERAAAEKKAVEKKAAEKKVAEEIAYRKKVAEEKAAKEKAAKKEAKAAKKKVTKKIHLGDLVLLDQGPVDKSNPDFYSAESVGVIVRLKKKKFHILNMHGDVVKVKQKSVSKIKDTGVCALDFEDNRIRVGDVVKIILGPHAGHQGTIKHIYRFGAFLHSQRMTENEGFFVCNLRFLVSVLLDSGGLRGAFERPKTPDPVPIEEV